MRVLYFPTYRRFPGDHAKWVGSPHGHATVSGERRLYAQRHSILDGCGKARAAAAIRESGHLSTGTSLIAFVIAEAAPAAKAGAGGPGAKDANGGLMVARIRIFVSAFLLFTPIAASAQNTPAPTPPTVHETVVVTATGRDMPESKVGA